MARSINNKQQVDDQDDDNEKQSKIRRDSKTFIARTMMIIGALTIFALGLGISQQPSPLAEVVAGRHPVGDVYQTLRLRRVELRLSGAAPALDLVRAFLSRYQLGSYNIGALQR